MLHTMYGNCGYKIIIKKTNYKIFHITDVSNLDHIKAQNYDLYMVEANYNDEEIKQRIEKEMQNGEFLLGKKVENCHLSESQWNKFMLQNAGDNSECIKIHQHKERKEKK